MSHDGPPHTPGLSFADSGWEPPRPLSQHTLFGDDTERSLAAAGITPEQANEWFEWGWLSSMPAFMDSIDEPAWAELLFVRDLSKLDAPREAITAMLKRLPRPFVYDPCRIAFSFRYGWVELPSRRPPKLDLQTWGVELVLQWVQLAARRGQHEDLRQLFEGVSSALDAVDPD